jgi:hypothetical protein
MPWPKLKVCPDDRDLVENAAGLFADVGAVGVEHCRVEVALDRELGNRRQAIADVRWSTPRTPPRRLQLQQRGGVGSK